MVDLGDAVHAVAGRRANADPGANTQPDADGNSGTDGHARTDAGSHADTGILAALCATDSDTDTGCAHADA